MRYFKIPLLLFFFFFSITNTRAHDHMEESSASYHVERSVVGRRACVQYANILKHHDIRCLSIRAPVSLPTQLHFYWVCLQACTCGFLFFFKWRIALSQTNRMQRDKQTNPHHHQATPHRDTKRYLAPERPLTLVVKGVVSHLIAQALNTV